MTEAKVRRTMTRRSRDGLSPRITTDGTTMTEPIKMTSSLPGDAHATPSPSPSPPPASQPPVSAAAAPEASTSTVPYTEPKTHTLVSVHPSDPSKQRSFPCRYFLAPSADFPPSSRFLDLPESYFTPTAVELQQAFAGQVKRREELIDKPLLTKKLREREEAQKNRSKASKWPQTRVRVRFGDRSQLEGIFPSTDKLVHLYEFVKLALREDLRETPFLLCESSVDPHGCHAFRFELIPVSTRKCGP